MPARKTTFELVKEKLVSYYGETIWTDTVAQELLDIVKAGPREMPDDKGLPFDPSAE